MVKCKLHPNYKGKLPPRSDREDCACLAKFINEQAKIFWRSVPAKFRPGTRAALRHDVAMLKKLIRGGTFPPNMGSGIYRGVGR